MLDFVGMGKPLGGRNHTADQPEGLWLLVHFDVVMVVVVVVVVMSMADRL